MWSKLGDKLKGSSNIESLKKIPICIRNMTWYEGTTFTSHSSKFVAA